MTSHLIHLSLVILIFPFFRHGNQNKERLHFPSSQGHSRALNRGLAWTDSSQKTEFESWSSHAQMMLFWEHTTIHPRVENTPSTSCAPKSISSACQHGTSGSATHSYPTPAPRLHFTAFPKNKSGVTCNFSEPRGNPVCHSQRRTAGFDNTDCV